MNSGENKRGDVEVDKICTSHLSGCSGLTEPHPDKRESWVGERGGGGESMNSSRKIQLVTGKAMEQKPRHALT